MGEIGLFGVKETLASPITISGSVQLLYDTTWRQRWKLRREGWCPHRDGYGRECLIRFCWPPDDPHAERLHAQSMGDDG